MNCLPLIWHLGKSTTLHAVSVCVEQGRGGEGRGEKGGREGRSEAKQRKEASGRDCCPRFGILVHNTLLHLLHMRKTGTNTTDPTPTPPDETGCSKPVSSVVSPRASQ